MIKILKNNLCLIPVLLSAFLSTSCITLDRISDRVTMGNDAFIGEYPHQVFLGVIKGEYGRSCGGTIINEKTILTAAHCVVQKGELWDASRSYIEYGGVRLRNMNRMTTLKFIPHPEYDADTKNNDIAIVHLPRPLIFTGETASIILPASNSRELKEGHELVVTGYGRTSYRGRSSKRLQYAFVDYIPKEICRSDSAYGASKITDEMICAGFFEGGRDACQGDSGGPLIDRKINQLIGVVSWGDGCGFKDRPGVYADVSKYIDWINTNKLQIN